jgi:hypothetical protein
MKKLFILLALSISSYGISQDLIKYNIIKNEPLEPKNSFNLEFLNMDVNSKFVDNTSFNVGLFGFSKISNKLMISYQANKSYGTLGGLLNKKFPGNLDINGGIQFFISEKTIDRKVDVVLDSKQRDVGNTRYTTTKSLTVPATILKKIGFQGGILMKRSALEFEDSQNALAHTGIGFYAGLISRKITNVIITDEKYGNSFRSFGSDVFFDALIIPVNRFKDITNNTLESHKGFPIGFRCGYKLYQVEKKEFTGKRFGIAGTASFGYRPFQGWNLSAGIGISILKQ